MLSTCSKTNAQGKSVGLPMISEFIRLPRRMKQAVMGVATAIMSSPVTIKRQTDDKTQCTSVAGQSSIARPMPSSVWQDFNGKYHFQQVVLIVSPIVEDAMSQPASDEHTDEAIEEQGVKFGVIYSAVFVFAAYDEVGEEQPDKPTQAVVMNG